MREMIFTAFEVHKAQVITEIISEGLSHNLLVRAFRVLSQTVEILREFVFRELIFFIVVCACAEFRKPLGELIGCKPCLRLTLKAF